MTSLPPVPNPFGDPPLVSAPPRAAADDTAKESYNIVSDTVFGINARKSDNLFQLKVVLISLAVCLPLGAVLGAVLVGPEQRLGSAAGFALMLGFLGVVVGLFGSGIYLMIYRAVRHWKGKHD